MKQVWPGRLTPWSVVSVLAVSAVSAVYSGCAGGRSDPGFCGDAIWRGRRLYSVQPQKLSKLQIRMIGESFGSTKGHANCADRSGDLTATDLPAGTSIFEIMGSDRDLRFAAGPKNALRIYEIDADPAATTGSDLLDLGNSIVSIRLVRDADQEAIASWVSPSQVDALTNELLNAPVENNSEVGDATYQLEFVRDDGTSSRMTLWPTSAVLGRGIALGALWKAELRRFIG